MVDEVISWDDEDGTAIGAIQKVLNKFTNEKIIFANGGDRNKNNIPELDKFSFNKKIDFVFGVGGEDKINSSSWILSNWNKK